MVKELMKNKKGWIRIVEALVAILLIIGFLTIILESKNEKSDISEKVYLTENAILREIQINNTFRTYILNLNEVVEFEDFDLTLKNHITSRIPDYLDCTSKICGFDNSCLLDEESEKNVYVKSMIIAADAETYNPNQIKLFCWTL